MATDRTGRSPPLTLSRSEAGPRGINARRSGWAENRPKAAKPCDQCWDVGYRKKSYMPPTTHPSDDTSNSQRSVADFSGWLVKERKSEATVKQYESAIGLFLKWVAEEKQKPGYEPGDADELLYLGDEWLITRRDFDLLSKSTIAVYATALSTYGQFRGFAVNFRAQIKRKADRPVASKNRRRRGISDRELKAIRGAYGNYSIERAFVELAIAGLSYKQMSEVGEAAIEYSRHYRVARISVSDETESGGKKLRWGKGIFDPVTLKWLTKTEARSAIAKGAGTSEAAIAKILRTTCKGHVRGTPLRSLREVGIRRAVQAGYSPIRIAATQGIGTIPTRWWTYANSGVRNQLMNPYFPEWEDRRDAADEITIPSIDELLEIPLDEFEERYGPKPDPPEQLIKSSKGPR